MISKKRHKLTMMLLTDLICEYDSILTLSKILGIPKTTIHSWKRRNNISDAGLEIIASNSKMQDIYQQSRYNDIRNREWY